MLAKKSSGRPEMSWVPVRDREGRTRMEMRWQTQERVVPVERQAA